uniref:non-specific serine/threonine protein kinase n=1 Tax=Naja naja TaxID=35670 RepID=A0A8C6V4F5_NAJNA
MCCWAFELATGKHLFEPQAGQYFSRDDAHSPHLSLHIRPCFLCLSDHVARIIELLGKIPPKTAFLWQQTSTFFSRGSSPDVLDLFLRLYHILVDKYSWPKPQATHFTRFVLPMLEYAPERRARADKCLQHPWLSH